MTVRDNVADVTDVTDVTDVADVLGGIEGLKRKYGAGFNINPRKIVNFASR